MIQAMERERINPFNLFHGAFTPNWLLQRTEVSAGAKLCYARLCQYAGNKGHCYPKHEDIAKEIGVSHRSVIRHIEELITFNLIEVAREKHNNLYYFLWHKWMSFKESRYDKLTHLEKSRYAKNGKQDMPSCHISIYKELKESVKENHILSESELSDEQTLNSSSIKNKRVKPVIDYQTQIEAELKKFGDIKNLTENFIAVAASRNKTGTIAESRHLSLLCQLSAVLTAIGDKGIFKEALLEVIAKGVDNINYLKKVVESKKQKQTKKEANDDARYGQEKSYDAAGRVLQVIK